MRLNDQIKNGRLAKEEARGLKEKVKNNKVKKNEYYGLLDIFRDVGDGIAFIYLNKWDIKPLCMEKEPAGFLLGKKGRRFELKVFRSIMAKRMICIYNDITHSLRHGDITTPKFGLPLTIEVKSGRSSKNNARAQRQLTRINKILSYLVEDSTEGLYSSYEGITMYRHAMVEKERHHRRKLGLLLDNAFRLKQSTTKKIENGLYYNVTFTKEGIERELKKLPKNGSWCAFFVNDFMQVKEGYYPFTLTIKNPEILLEFYEGNFLIMVFVDIDLIRQKVEDAGYKMIFEPGGDYCLRLENEEAQLAISSHFFRRISAEFVSLDWMIQEFISRSKRLFD